MRVNEVADILVGKLKKEGFIIQRSDSYTTNSVYLKMDYGLCKSIRIGDHKGIKKYRFRFQVRVDSKKSRVIKKGNYKMYIYCVDDIDKLVENVIDTKKSMVRKYGMKKYKKMMNKNKMDNLGKKGFWSKAKII